MTSVAPAFAQPARSSPDPQTFQYRDLTKELANKMSGTYVVAATGDLLMQEPIGKMIDPFLLRDKDVPDKWWCFYKQNGNVHCVWSPDLQTWTTGATELAHGENPCVIVQGGEYR